MEQSEAQVWEQQDKNDRPVDQPDLEDTREFSPEEIAELGLLIELLEDES